MKQTVEVNYTGELNATGEREGLGTLTIENNDFIVKYEGKFKENHFVSGTFTRYNKKMTTAYHKRIDIFNSLLDSGETVGFRKVLNQSYDVNYLNKEEVDPILIDIEMAGLKFEQSQSDPLYPFLPCSVFTINLYWINPANVIDSYREFDRKVVHKKSHGEGKFQIDLPLYIKDIASMQFDQWNDKKPYSMTNYTACTSVKVPGNVLDWDLLKEVGLAAYEITSNLAVYRTGIDHINDKKTLLNFIKHKGDAFVTPRNS